MEEIALSLCSLQGGVLHAGKKKKIKFLCNFIRIKMSGYSFMFFATRRGGECFILLGLLHVCIFYKIELKEAGVLPLSVSQVQISEEFQRH